MLCQESEEAFAEIPDAAPVLSEREQYWKDTLLWNARAGCEEKAFYPYLTYLFPLRKAFEG